MKLLMLKHLTYSYLEFKPVLIITEQLHLPKDKLPTDRLQCFREYNAV